MFLSHFTCWLMGQSYFKRTAAFQCISLGNVPTILVSSLLSHKKVCFQHFWTIVPGCCCFCPWQPVVESIQLAAAHDGKIHWSERGHTQQFDQCHWDLDPVCKLGCLIFLQRIGFLTAGIPTHSSPREACQQSDLSLWFAALSLPLGYFCLSSPQICCGR